jgi:tetratricopeptide (TPR) repeat protein
VLQTAYDPSHPLVLGNLSDLGRCLTDLGEYDDAEAILLEAYAGLEPQRDQHGRVFDSLLIRLGRLYRAMGNEDEAARYEGMRTDAG